MDLSKLERDIQISKYFAIIALILVPVIYFSWFGVGDGQSISKDITYWGTFGDFLGGTLNPLIAFFAFYWLTKSVLIQKKELSDTKTTLAETEQTHKLMRFESSFYSLLEQMNHVYQVLEESKIGHRGNSKASKVDALYDNVFNHGNEVSINVCCRRMKDKSENCSHFFRVLYQLLKFILMQHSKGNNKTFNDETIGAPLSDTEKFYSSIVRSFLNRKVTNLLAINCAESNPDDDYFKYKLLIERYSMLEHMSLDDVLMRQLCELFDGLAFGDNPEYLKLNKDNSPFK